MIEKLASVGALFLIVAVVFIAYGLLLAIREGLRALKWRYRYKHRFDKPPTAACYCRDCKRHDDKTQRCYKFGQWATADNWFCWDAEPRDME